MPFFLINVFFLNKKFKFQNRLLFLSPTEFHILRREILQIPCSSSPFFVFAESREILRRSVKVTKCKNLKMDRKVNHNSVEMPLRQSPESFSFPSSVNYNRFGGVRHGFNISSNRTQPYPHVSNFIPQPYRLPSIPSTPSDPDVNNRNQVRKFTPHLKMSTWPLGPISAESLKYMFGRKR